MKIEKNYLSGLGYGLVLVFLFVGCGKDSDDSLVEDEIAEEEIAPGEVSVFDDVRVVAFKHTNERKSNLTYLDGGRLVMRKLSLPEYDQKMKVKAKITLQSAGDPYDRVGCAFFSKSRITFNEVEKELALVGQWDKAGAGVIAEANGDYKPVVELLHFATPFGAGYYSSRVTPEGGVSQWESNVVWERDVTELLGELKGEIWMGVWIDTWSSDDYAQNGFRVNLSLQYAEDEEGRTADQLWVEPLFNTAKISAKQKYYDKFSESDLEVSFNVPEGLSNVQLYYQTTGHGPFDGDEFNSRKHTLWVDGKEILQYSPWRTDCRDFRKYNPSTHKNVDGNGTWSSDLDRSNWCPGSMVEPRVVNLDDLNSGDHVLKIHVDGALSGDSNFWASSGYLVGEKAE